jgi:hypothetical protein
MEKSNSIVNLTKALLAFHVKVGKIKKDANNPFFKSKYASLSNILDEIELPMQESGLVVSQLPSGINGLTTMLIHAESGEYIQSEYFMQPVKSDPQATGSAISYARRYALTAILALNVDDDDANTATHGSSAPKQAAPAAPNGDEKPWLNKWANKEQTKETDEWGKVLKAMVDGVNGKVYTVADVKKKYNVNKASEAELKAFEKKY